MAEDLGRWLQGQTIWARRAPWLRRAAAGLRRHRRLVTSRGVLAVVAIIITAVVLLKSSPTTTQPVSKEPIILLRDGKLTCSPRIVLGEGRWAPLADGALRVQSDDLMLTELYAHVPWESYRFEADVADVGEETFDEVGLYAVHGQFDTSNGPEHWFAALRFSEQAQVRPSNPRWK